MFQTKPHKCIVGAESRGRKEGETFYISQIIKDAAVYPVPKGRRREEGNNETFQADRSDF